MAEWKSVERIRSLKAAIEAKTGKTHADLTDGVKVLVLGYGTGSGEEPKTYILVDEDGNEIPAVFVTEETIFDATANDIRLGKTAATEDGILTGEKVIPSYNTAEGSRLIPNGSTFIIPNIDTTINYYDYSKLQVIICGYNSSMSNSVSAEKVCINDKVYNVNSIESIASVTKDHNNKSINLGITNNTGKPCIVRYFTYKEVV